MLYEMKNTSNNGYGAAMFEIIQRCGDGMQIKETSLIMQGENED